MMEFTSREELFKNAPPGVFGKYSLVISPPEILNVHVIKTHPRFPPFAAKIPLALLNDEPIKLAAGSVAVYLQVAGLIRNRDDLITKIILH
jgi:hypothetical protein